MLFISVDTSHAQMLFLSDSRYISVSGFANAHVPPSSSSNYFSGQSPSAPFAEFSSDINRNADSFSPGTGPNGLDVSAMARSRAWQDSTLTSRQLIFHAGVVTETSSRYSAFGGATRAQAESRFEVTFSVPSIQTYQLTWDKFSFAHDYPMLEATLSLTPVGQDAILDLPTTRFSNGQIFTGVLDPGHNYTLKLHLGSLSAIPDPLGELGFVTGDMTFTVVPEPVSFLLFGLSGMGIFALCLRRDR